MDLEEVAEVVARNSHALRLTQNGMEENPVKPVSGHSGFVSDDDQERLGCIYTRLQQTNKEGPVMEDLKFLYLKVQEGQQHEALLREKIDALVKLLLQQGQTLLRERVNFRTHYFY